MDTNISVAKFKKGAVNIIKKILGVTLGAVIMAVAFNALVIPYGLLSGGVGGLALMGEYLFNLPVSLGIFVLNIPIFFWGLKELKKKLIIYSLLGTFIMILALPLTRPFISVPKIDLFLASIYSGVVGGLGAGLVFRFGASTGGTDIISMVMKKKKNIGVGTFLFYTNISVLALFVFFFNLKTVMYTALSMWVSGKVTDFVIEGINRNKSVTIISDKSDVIAKRIIGELNRGVTLLDGHGGFSGTFKQVITCVVNNFEIGRLKELVVSIDEHAFMFVTETAYDPESDMYLLLVKWQNGVRLPIAFNKEDAGKLLFDEYVKNPFDIMISNKKLTGEIGDDDTLKFHVIWDANFNKSPQSSWPV